MKHIALAEQVINMLLEGENDILSQLREQFENALVISEEDSEAGFFINFKVKETVNQSKLDTFHIGDVFGNYEDVKYAVGFILFVENGYISMLEGYVNALDKWPKNDIAINLVYFNMPRDIVF